MKMKYNLKWFNPPTLHTTINNKKIVAFGTQTS